MKKIIGVIIALMVSVSLMGQSANGATFLGYSMGMSEGSFLATAQQHGKTAVKFDFKIKTVTRYTIEGYTIYGLDFTLLADVYEGVVKHMWAIHMNTNPGRTGAVEVSTAFIKAMMLIKERYGKATKIDVKTAPAYGNRFVDALADGQGSARRSWELGNVSIALSVKKNENMFQFDIEYVNPTFMDYLKAEEVKLDKNAF